MHSVSNCVYFCQSCIASWYAAGGSPNTGNIIARLKTICSIYSDQKSYILQTVFIDVTVALLLFLTDSWSSSDFLTCVHPCVNVTVMKQKTVHAMMRNRSTKPVITLIILHVADEQFTGSFILLVTVTVWRNELVDLLFLQIPFFTPYFHFEDNSSTSALTADHTVVCERKINLM